MVDLEETTAKYGINQSLHISSNPSPSDSPAQQEFGLRKRKVGDVQYDGGHDSSN
jgi:hypothetical protein